jgi:uncharacterized membrane protein
LYEILLILHFVGLALGVGTSFAGLTLRLSMRELPPAERSVVAGRFRALGKNGSIGLALLILTGFGMWFTRGIRETMTWGGGAFHAKLTLVVLLAGTFGYLQMLQKKAARDPAGSAMTLIPKVSTLLLVLGVGVIVAAVLAFK